jgi:hypothetical protein
MQKEDSLLRDFIFSRFHSFSRRIAFVDVECRLFLFDTTCKFALYVNLAFRPLTDFFPLRKTIFPLGVGVTVKLCRRMIGTQLTMRVCIPHIDNVSVVCVFRQRALLGRVCDGEDDVGAALKVPAVDSARREWSFAVV